MRIRPSGTTAAARRRNHKLMPYVRCEGLLSRGELAFYHALQAAVSGRYAISIKTRLADILKCPDRLWKTVHGRRLAQKHVDFVLYDPRTTAVAVIVELDDRSHRHHQRRLRDRFVNKAFYEARVPLLRVHAAGSYDPTVVLADIARAIAIGRHVLGRGGCPQQR